MSHFKKGILAIFLPLLKILNCGKIKTWPRQQVKVEKTAEENNRKERWKPLVCTGGHTVPETEAVWSRPHTASKRQIWTRIESSMKVGTCLFCSLQRWLKPHRYSKNISFFKFLNIWLFYHLKLFILYWNTVDQKDFLKGGREVNRKNEFGSTHKACTIWCPPGNSKRVYGMAPGARSLWSIGGKQNVHTKGWLNYQMLYPES